ncbi:MAG: hypothetical protein ACKO0W_01295, partial [Planctomycetota bacterium]
MAFLDSLPGGFRISAPAAIAGAAIGISAVVVAVNLGSLFGTVFASSVDEEEADPLALLSEESGTFLETSRKRFEGRSMFSLPTPPRRDPPPPPPRTEPEPPKDPPPPPIPAAYSGPAVTHVIGEYVLFGDLRIKRGETEAGITVISIDLPYSVKLGHRGGEYVVPLWPKIDERLLKGGSPPARSSGVVAGAGRVGELSSGGTPGGTSSGFTSRAGDAGATAGATPAIPAGTTTGTVIRGTASGNRSGASGGRSSSPGTPAPNGAPAGGAPAGAPAEVPPDEDGAGEPVPGATEPPSQAMQPVRLPPPASSDNRPVEYVDRSLLPPRRSEDEINRMTVDQARGAL